MVDRSIRPFEPLYRCIAIEAYNQLVAMIPGGCQRMYMAGMQNIKTSIGEDDTVTFQAPRSYPLLEWFDLKNFLLYL